jgi:Fe-S-cluster containining protein
MDTFLRHILPPPEIPGRASRLRGEELCALCAAEGLSCCRTDPDMARLSFPLSAPEWRRLRPYAALAPELPSQGTDEAAQRIEAAGPPQGERSASFEDCPPQEGDAVCVPEENSPEFLQALHRLFPGEKARLERTFPPGRRHLRLRLRPDGSCFFQGEAGCRLPREARPWYCRLFPAWVLGRMATLFQSETCLIARQARSPAQGLEMLNTTPGETRRLYDALRADWRLLP